MFTYPLTLSYKFFTIGKKIMVQDSNGHGVLFVEMKNFKLKEDISVYDTPTKNRELFQIKADRIIDFSGTYRFYENGKELGSVRRKGFKSFLSAHYDLFDSNEQQTHVINEENPWIKVADTLFGFIPFGELISGYFFHPKYVVFAVDQDKTNPIYRLTKKPSFLEANFTIDQIQGVKSEQEKVMLLSLLLVTLLEKYRG